VSTNGLARSEYIARRENVIAVGNSGTGKTHIALGLGLAACHMARESSCSNARSNSRIASGAKACRRGAVQKQLDWVE
jgi:DNA replication protein DnaC